MNASDHDWSIPHVAAHRHSSHHRGEIERSETCGCFHCLALFHPSRVVEWIDEIDGAGTTAVCPRCGIDAVIGSAAGYPMHDGFLAQMWAYWFFGPRSPVKVTAQRLL